MAAIVPIVASGKFIIYLTGNATENFHVAWFVVG